MKNIVLLGLPGTGKTGLGRILARDLGYNFFDTDEMIKNLCGKEPKTLLKERARVRLLSEERLLANKLTKEREAVIAYGGGIFSSETLDILCNDAYSVYLYASPKTILERVKRKGSGILINNIREEAEMSSYLAAAKERYEPWTDCSFNMDSADISDIAREFVNKYNNS